MVSNLAKTPLMAVIYASLLPFAVGFLPLSEPYRAAMHEFEAPLSASLFVLLYGLLLSIVIAVAFGSMERVGIVDALMTILTLIGLGLIAPAIHPFWFGDPTGIMTRTDLLLLTGARVLCTILFVVLAVLLLGKKGAAKPEKSGHKIGKLALVVRMIALPILFILLYLTCWYFFGWNSEIVRLYYGSTAVDEGFVAAVVNRLVADGAVLLYCLLTGLVYALFSLPLMLRLPGKRLVYILSTTLLFLSSALLRLIPTPLMPDDVRLKLLVQDAVLLGVYGILCSVLLHLSYKKQAASSGKKGKGAALDLDDDANDAKSKGASPKQQAEAVRMTMNGK